MPRLFPKFVQGALRWFTNFGNGALVVKSETLAEVNVERAARRPVIVVTDTANGEQRLVKAKEIATDPLSAELSKQLRMGKSGMIEAAGKKLFLNVYAPTARLVIVGAVHISQALAPLARSLNYDVTVVDPRTAFASPERFPDVPLIAEWPDVALPPLNVDHYTLLKQAVLTVKGVPMLYLPILYYPTKKEDRATGFLLPTYGSSTLRGQSIHNAFFWAIDRSQDATLLHDWFSKTGQGYVV